jgi:hypothetical protein
MPRSDPPPPFPAPEPPAADTSRRAVGRKDDDQGRPDSDPAELAIDESAFLLEEDAEEEVIPPFAPKPAGVPTRQAEERESGRTFDQGDDPCPSPFERVTIAPPLPEREYVAQMMGKVADSDRPKHKGAATPPPPTRKAPFHRYPPDAVPSGESKEPGESHDDPPSGTLRRRITMPGYGSGPKAGARPSENSGPHAPEPHRSTEGHAALTLDLTESVPPKAPGSIRSSPSASTVPPPRGSTTERNAARAAPELDQTLAFGPASGDALELVGTRAQSRPPRPSAINLRKVRDRFDVGDFSGALVLAEGILEQDPENGDAMLYAEHCRDVLKQMYISRLGGVRRVPQIGVSPEQLRWLSLDHRAGFLLSLVDGQSTVDEVLDMSGMPDLEALRLLVQLLQQNVIKLV